MEQGKKNKLAIALEYQAGERAPKVIAQGRGILADKITEEAKKHRIPVHRDAPLADTLARLEIGEMIPPELYEVVAEVLVFVDALDRLAQKGIRP